MKNTLLMLGHLGKMSNIEPEYCSFHKGDMVG